MCVGEFLYLRLRLFCIYKKYKSNLKIIMKKLWKLKCDLFSDKSLSG